MFRAGRRVKSLAAAALCAFLAAVSGGLAQDGESARQTWVLLLDLGTPAGAPAREPARADIEAFAASLRRHAGVSPSRVTAMADGPLSRESISASVARVTKSMEPGGALVLHVRGYVTKPASERAIYLRPGDSDLASPAHDDPRAIRDTELIAWLDEAPADTQALLFLDLHTMDESLLVYFASRPSIGDASVTTVSASDARESMAAAMSRLLGEGADTDANAIVDIHEVGRLYRDELYENGATTAEVIAGLTGDALPLFSLPSAIIIGGPPGARALVDGAYVGDTPLRYKPCALGAYDVAVEAPGYRRPDPRVVELTRPMGQAERAGFLLDRIRIHGEVVAPDGASVGTLVVGVMPGEGVVARLDGAGPYEVPEGDVAWSVGSEYRVLAGSPDERYFGAASFIYDGFEDIAVDILLTERTLWEVAGIYHSKGLAVEAARAAGGAASELLDVPDDLDPALGLVLLDLWSGKTSDARTMIACARITNLTHGAKPARGYWRLAKRASVRKSDERRIAAAGMRASGNSYLVYALAGILALAASGGVAVARRRRAPTE